MMKIAANYSSRKTPDLLKLASKDTSRPVLACLYLDVDVERGSFIVGTDSYKLAAVPVEAHPADVSGLVPAEAVKAWQTAWRAWRGSAEYGPELLCSSAEEVRLELPTGVQVWKRPAGQYPAWRQLVPTELSGFKVRLSAKLLLELAQGLGSEEVTLEFCRRTSPEEGEGVGYFPVNTRPIVVHNGSHGEAAVLMPIRMAE